MHRVYFLLMTLLPQIVFADINIPGIRPEDIKQPGYDMVFANTGIKENIDDITDDQDIDKVVLTEKDNHEAKVWQLTEEEEKRFKLLMQNKSAIYYEGLRLTPLDILGINARNEKERDHFAKLSAYFEAQKVAKNLAWNNAHFKAYQQVVAGLPVVRNFDASKHGPYAYRPIVLKTGQQLHFYLRALTTFLRKCNIRRNPMCGKGYSAPFWQFSQKSFPK